MRILNREAVKRLRDQYPVGCRVALEHMNDRQAPPIGTKGTVLWVDDAGNLVMQWDNGCGLNVVLDGGDRVRILDSVTVICYGETEVWDDRKEAERFYLEAMNACDRSERERYSNIYCSLIAGDRICKDGDDE